MQQKRRSAKPHNLTSDSCQSCDVKSHVKRHCLTAALNIKPRQIKLYTRSQIPAVLNAYLDSSGSDVIDPLPFMAAASVLPMRANNYVVEELIDWSNVPEDPIFQLVFPQPGKSCADRCNGVDRHPK